MKKHVVALLIGALSLSCAEKFPGKSPPKNRLHFPVGMAYWAGDTPAEDLLIVGNSNFDQRYNSGTVMVLSAAELLAQAVTDAATPGATHTRLPILSVKRIDSFCGDVGVFKTGAGPRVYVPSRGVNRLTMFKLDGPQLRCNPLGVEAIDDLDCAPSHVIHTGSDDPFSMTFIPAASDQGMIAIGHLPTITTQVDQSAVLSGRLTLVDVARFEARIEQEKNHETLLGPQIVLDLPGMTGVTGVGLVDRFSTSAVPSIAVTSKDSATEVLNMSFLDLTLSNGSYAADRRITVNLGSEARAFHTRGFVVNRAQTRAYVSVRHQENGDSSNAGIAVIKLDGASPQVLSVLEVGQEIGTPALLEPTDPLAPKLLYVPDSRSDSVWILDVSTDVLRVAKELTPFGRRVRMLDAPTTVVFAPDGRERFAFVTNFASGTLAVIDARSNDPRDHQIISRLGKFLGPDGDEEKKDE